MPVTAIHPAAVEYLPWHHRDLCDRLLAPVTPTGTRTSRRDAQSRFIAREGGDFATPRALVSMDIPRIDRDIALFVVELVNTGAMLRQVAADLEDALPDDAYPGEEPRAVVLEMLCGTISTALGSVDPSEVRRATELIARAGERTREHLELALAMSRRMHGADGGAGRTYG